MTAPLKVFVNRNSPKPRHCVINVNSDDANDDAFMKEYQRMIARFEIVGMVFDVDFRLATVLK